jgi:hypothetical protein
MTFERRLVIPATGTRIHPIDGNDDTDYCVANSFGGTVTCRVIVSAPADYIVRSGSFWLGTGGSLHSGLRFEDPRFSGATVEDLSRHGIVPMPTVAEMLGAIKHHLWLTLVDIARVLRVQRPTVYAWLDGTQQPRNGNAQRLSAIFRVAENSREIAHASAARLGTTERTSLLELLTADTIDEAMCRTLLERVTARGAAPVSRPQLTTTGSSAKSSAMQDASRQRAIRRFGGRKRG